MGDGPRANYNADTKVKVRSYQQNNYIKYNFRYDNLKMGHYQTKLRSASSVRN